MFWFGFGFVVVRSYHCFGVSRESEHNPSLVVATETREYSDEKQKVTRPLMSEMNAA